MIRLLYRQIMRNCRELGWDESRGVPLNIYNYHPNKLSDIMLVKYHWDVEWGEGYSHGFVFSDQPRPELHSLLYDIKSNIWNSEEKYLDLLFRITKQTGEWKNDVYYDDDFSTLIYSAPLDSIDNKELGVNTSYEKI